MFQPTVGPTSYGSHDWMDQFSIMKECISHLTFTDRRTTFDFSMSEFTGAATHPNGSVTAVTAAWMLTFCIADAVQYNRPAPLGGLLASFVIYVPADGVQSLTDAVRAVRFRPNLLWENMLKQGIVAIIARP